MRFLAKWLEKLGLRCGNCSAWNNSKVAIVRREEWGTNAGGMLLMDPFYIVTRDRRCQCGHLMSSSFIRTE
jgi:hypothetical protein